MKPSNIEIAASVCFACAILHTFLTSIFKKLACKYKEGSIRESFFHLLGEVEVVFGIWAAVLLLIILSSEGSYAAIFYLESRNFSETIFVFAILACSATRPILHLAETFLDLTAKTLPLAKSESLFFVTLAIGPLLGSLITEPAAMTVTALLLKNFYFDQDVSGRFKYITLGVLFVNISVGGVLTSYAAPPVLMVAERWDLNLFQMLSVYGWKAVIICILNSIFALMLLKDELTKLNVLSRSKDISKVPIWVVFVHLFFLALLVICHRHASVVIGLFLFFLGFINVARKYQNELKLRESLLVSFFLGGLVVLGGLQSWWLGPLIQNFHSFSLFLGATLLTSITDNAALTYLGAQISDASAVFKYALLSGAVVGGGLTVIANAPNPVGHSILQESFGDEGIQPTKLFVAALVPTFIAGMVFWLFR